MVCPAEVQNPVFCIHGVLERIQVRLRMNGKVYYGLIDTDTQIPLVNASVMTDMEQMSWQIPRRSTSEKP